MGWALSATAAPMLEIRGRAYPVLLPKLRDPRLHLAATITSLQVIGQVGFHFQVSIAQILLALGTSAALEIAIAFRSQHVIMWPASAMLTGNGVAFVLRVPGTAHGDWWSLRGWWIFVATAAVSLLSKHVIKWRGEHIFNPSNIGLVLCFLILGRNRANPLDFWWGPMSAWLVIAVVVIVAGGFAILRRLHLLRVALGFWFSFAAGIGVLALAGHAMTARWHLGPITGFHLWWVLITSPEVLVFLFFMITDPKTAPRSPTGRLVYAVTLGLLAAVLIAPTTTEFAAKVALLGSLAIVCVAIPLLRLLPVGLDRRLLLAAAPVAIAAGAVVIVLANAPAGASAYRPLPPGVLPPITILPSHGVQTKLDPHTAQLIAHDLLAVQRATTADTLRVWLAPGGGQSPPIAVAQLTGRTYRLTQVGTHWRVENPSPVLRTQAPVVSRLTGLRLTNVAAQAGINFKQGAFRYGLVQSDNQAMMGGGVCWLDYNGDGWMDLFVVNGYADDNLPGFQAHGGLPTTALYENVHGHFVDVSKKMHAALPVRGEGCVAGDFDGDGRPDIFITTSTDDVLLWNDGNRFVEGARSSGIVSYGWHAGAAVADVNGDGRPDLFVAGYTDIQHPIVGSLKGFPGNYRGIPDELFLNLGHRHFRNVTKAAGLDDHPNDHGLGAEFMDANGDGRPDLYVANDEDPNRLYLNERGGPLGFHFVDVARAEHVADPNAGMGIADQPGGLLFISNSRGQTHAVYRQNGSRFTDVRKELQPAFGTNLTGWGDSWIDLQNSGTQELVLANGEIPITNLAKDALAPVVIAQRDGRWVNAGLLDGLRANGRGLAAADYDNDGRVDVVVNTIGGKLILLHNTSAAGNWLEVSVAPFSPGALVTAVDSSGRSQTQVVRAGSSYLSSEDPRVHFGFGSATVRSLSVRYPDGTVKRVSRPPTNAILTVKP